MSEKPNILPCTSVMSSTFKLALISTTDGSKNDTKISGATAAADRAFREPFCHSHKYSNPPFISVHAITRNGFPIAFSGYDSAKFGCGQPPGGITNSIFDSKNVFACRGQNSTKRSFATIWIPLSRNFAPYANDPFG